MAPLVSSPRLSLRADAHSSVGLCEVPSNTSPLQAIAPAGGPHDSA